MSNSERLDLLVSITSILLLGVVLGAWSGNVHATNKLEQKAIDMGVGIYCPIDGHFAFVGKCDE